MIIQPYTHTKPHRGAPYDTDHEQVQGLVGWWLMNELGGPTLFDLIGNGNGTLTNFANPPTPSSGWNPGQFGSALAFNGTDNFVDTADFSVIEGSAQLTIAAWVKPDTLTTDDAIVSKGNTSGELILLFRDDVDGITGDTDGYSFVVDSVGAANRINSGTNTSESGIWQHVVGVMDGGKRFIYINGKLKNSSSGGSRTTVPASADNLLIGKTDLAANFEFHGMMDDVRVYKRALEQPLIERIAFDGSAMFKRRVFFDVAVAVGFAGALVNAPRLRSTIGGGLV